MILFNLKQMIIKFIHSYRITFAYLMVLSYICMHYVVSNTKFNDDHQKSDDADMSFSLTQASTNAPIILSRHSNKFRHLYKRNFLIYSSSWTSSSESKSTFLKKLMRKSEIRIDYDKKKASKYNLKNKTSTYFSQIYQDKLIVHMLNTTELNERNATHNGFFVEAGAFDGETWSNTLYLERNRNWTGLLIEPSTENYKLLLSKKRNAYSINSCLCSGKSSINSTYIEAGPFGITANMSKLSSSSSSSSMSTTSSSIYSVTCHPLAKLLDEFFSQYPQFKNKKSVISNENGTTRVIDYLSLDVEGSEQSVIQSFAWNSYKFNLINIEFNQNHELYVWIKNFLKPYGYHETIIDDVWYQDVFLAHESVYGKLNLNIKKMSEFVKLYKSL